MMVSGYRGKGKWRVVDRDAAVQLNMVKTHGMKTAGHSVARFTGNTLKQLVWLTSRETKKVTICVNTFMLNRLIRVITQRHKHVRSLNCVPYIYVIFKMWEKKLIKQQLWTVTAL